jgi:hypothetical protein
MICWQHSGNKHTYDDMCRGGVLNDTYCFFLIACNSLHTATSPNTRPLNLHSRLRPKALDHI